MIKQETIGKFNLTKSGDLLMKYTALNTFALNFLGGSANILMGRVQQRIEGFSGKYFTNKNLYNASYQYKKFLADFMKETASRRPHTFAGLLMRKFDVMQNFGEQARMTEMNRRGAWRLLNSRNLFFLNTMGEHFLYTRTFLAYADTIKLTLNGNPIKLVDAFEMKKINGIEELAIKKGVKNEDGSDFTDANINDISRTAADINQKLNGIYNRDDVAAAQYYVLGRMTAMFRKWIPTALQRRFGKEHYNYITNEVEKGFYNSFFNDFIWQSIRDMKNGQFRLASAWSRLDDNTKAGVRAALAEMGIWAFAGLLMPVIFGALGWDDDDDNDS
ncbi:MAG: hypothetical protein LBE56_12530 [Tannerella sp.]|nr:hypothetical protein [Tannerella sp.]